MNSIVDQNDIDQAVDLLLNRYKISTRQIHTLFPKKWYKTIDSVHKSFKAHGTISKKLTKKEFYALAVNKEGFGLFSGGKEEKKKLRKTILNRLDENIIKEQYFKFYPSGRYTAKGYQVSALAKQKWSNGKRWANAFVKATGFPAAFAGLGKQSKPPLTFELIEPKQLAPPLKDYQIKMKEEMLNILKGEGDKTRCMLTLPTGGGKTRVAVEAFVEWMQPRFSEGLYLIWIAQSEELCDQAAACIIDIWKDHEFVEDLLLVRYYKGSEVKLEKLDEYSGGGVIVASIGQIHNRIKNNDSAISSILENTGAVIIDEAHRAVTMMYRDMFTKAQELRNNELFPVCGLSATPGRTGFDNTGTKKLVELFEAKLIHPQLQGDPDYDDNHPIKYFKNKGYLSRAIYEKIEIDNGESIILSEEEIRKISEINENEANGEYEFDYELQEQGNRQLLKQLALNEERNRAIIERLMKIDDNAQTLVYTCNVDHAVYLSAYMNYRGIKSACVSSKTPTTERRMIIDDFKKGHIKFIFNYGVLTTGFDAPKTDHIELSRPILSDVLYEQIVGRGMRGPTFGGTSECRIIDFHDTIGSLGLPMTYARYKDYWDEEIGD